MTNRKRSKAFNFRLRDSQGRWVRLSSFKGRKVLLYFYPKDFTSGCTKEACDFEKARRAFEKLDVEIVGISPDSPQRHQKFAHEKRLNFTLLSDSEHLAAQKFGVWKQKSMYGKKFMGIERSTFLVDEQGRIVKEWRKVKVAGHVQELLEELGA